MTFPSEGSRARPARKEWLLTIATLMAIAFCLYANTFGNAWTYDDFPVIVENPDIRSWAAFFNDSFSGRPLRELTYALDYRLFGLEPAGWHIQNIFWHGLNAGLVFALVLRLGAGRMAAWVAALLFLVHPLQVEVVANLSHRKDSLALAFSLLAVLAYGRFLDHPKRSLLWALGSFALMGVAFLAKQNTFILPGVFLAYELSQVPRDRRLLLRHPRCAGIVLATLLGAGAWLWSSRFGAFLPKIKSYLAYKANYFETVTPEVYFRMVLKSWSFMFAKFFHPVDLALEYTYAVPSSWLDPWVLAALVGLGAFLAALWISFSYRKPVFFALAWVGLFWLPVSNLLPLAYFAADRYLYASSVGVAILVGIAICRLLRRPLPVAAIVLLMVGFLAGLTWHQNRVWRSPETLWTHAYRVSPESSFALNNLGNIHLLRGELLKAKEFYARSAEVNPLNATAHYNLGLIYERTGQDFAALQHYRRFLMIDEAPYREAAKALRTRLAREYGVEF